jgi:CRP-like cAMP-binding protein
MADKTTDGRFFDAVMDAQASDAIAAASHQVTFSRGAILMRQGDFGSSMFSIISGKVMVSVREAGGEEEVAMLGPGDFVGEISLLTGERRSATVTARSKVVALETPKTALAPILAKAPHLADKLAALVAERHAQLVQIHKDFGRWNSVGNNPTELAAKMTAFYSG